MSIICWSRQNLATAMNPNAEVLPDEIFRAVHTEFDLLLYRPMKTEKGKKVENAQKKNPREFLDLFLDKNKSQVQVAVLGSSGSGKSHLIQWMRLHIPPSQKIRVHAIPKARTSLRSIIEDIIVELPADKREVYQNRLGATAQQTSNPEQQRNFLLNNIASSIQMENAESVADELEKALIENLPSLFLDPHLRPNFFLQKGKIIDQLAVHIFATPGSYVPGESRKAFAAEDLPKYGNHFPRAAMETRHALDLLTIGDAVPKALRIINRNLNRAISFCLGFTGDSLIELMTDIRKDLVSRQEELVLLIEDFSRLQGVDYALLQALTTPETQAGKELSKLRWAMAVTKGYYESLPDTVHTRMEYVVDMDLPGADNKFIGRKGLASFSARYLNAARVGGERLRQWAESLHRDGTDPDSLPNACGSCELIDGCHSAFGEVNGYGLYPFTETALWNMALRADNELEEKFNPRSVIKEVLKGVLETYDSHLSQGFFPPRQLLNGFGGVQRLGALEESRLRELDNQDFDRRVSLIELWDGSGKIVNLKQEIHDWFELPLLDIQNPTEDPPPPGPEPPAPPTGDVRLRAIEEWARGQASLPENIAQELRESIYGLIEAAIDWNRHGIYKPAFFRKRGVMRLPAVYFIRQVTAEPNDPLRIRIPLHPEDESEFNRISIALQGLLKHRSQGHWNFDGGQEALALLIDLVEQWADHVLDIIKNLNKPAENWNPATAAMELLAIGAVLSGRIGREALSDVFAGAFSPWPQGGPLLSDSLKAIQKSIYENREKLISIIRTWRTASKGDTIGKMIIATDLEPAVRPILKGNIPSQVPPPPDGMTEEYRKLIEVYRRVSGELASAVGDELESRLEWIKEVDAQLESDENGLKLIGILSDLKEQLINCGLAIPRTLIRNFENALSGFQASTFDRTRKAYGVLKAAKPEERFRLLSRGSSVAVSDFSRLLAEAESLLQAAENGIKGMQSEKGGSAEQVVRNLDEIGKTINEVEIALNGMEASNAD